MRIQRPIPGALSHLEDLPVALYATDAEGRVVLWNRGMKVLTGVPQGLGCQPGALLRLAVDFSAVPSDNPVLAEVLRSGASVTIEGGHLVLSTVAAERAVDFYGDVLRDTESGEVLGALGLLVDKTRERTLEKTVDGFERTAAHDLRNAVGVLEGYLPLLLSGEANTMEDQGASIFNTLLRTSRLIQSILNLMLLNARIARNPLAGDRQTLLLKEIFLHSGRAVEPTAANKDVAFNTRVDGHLTVECLEEAFNAAIINLLFAATKLARNRSVIEMAAVAGGPGLEVTISFAAKGISSHDVQRMFSMHGEPQDPRLNVGVSVCLARAILKGHGCDLAMLTSDSGTNVFQFVLPMPMA